MFDTKVEFKDLILAFPKFCKIYSRKSLLMKTLVLGASPKSDRYSNMAVHSLMRSGHQFVALGARESEEDFKIIKGKPALEDIDTISLYLNPKRQEDYYDYMLSLKPRRVIFNPGTENMELQELLKRNNIESEIACTLVLLSTNQY